MSYYKKYLLVHYTKKGIADWGGRLYIGIAVNIDTHNIHQLKIIQQRKKQFPTNCKPHSTLVA